MFAVIIILLLFFGNSAFTFDEMNEIINEKNMMNGSTWNWMAAAVTLLTGYLSGGRLLEGRFNREQKIKYQVRFFCFHSIIGFYF